MPGELSTLLYGAIGGGIVAAALRTIETYWVSPRLTASNEARKKLHLYARPLFFSCRQAEFRLKHIKGQIEEKRSEGISSLKISPKDAKSLGWFTKDGYYIVSTAYLIAAVGSWISLFQRDVVFLPFRQKSLTTQFFNLIEEFKSTISTRTVLYYHYVDGIGERLVQEGQDWPMTLSRFSQRLYTDVLFRDYYDQLFQFLHKVARGRYSEQINATIQSLQAIKRFLAESRAVPEIQFVDTDVSADVD